MTTPTSPAYTHIHVLCITTVVLYTAPERVSSRLSTPNEKMVHRPLTEISLGSSSECLPKDEAMAHDNDDDQAEDDDDDVSIGLHTAL